MALAAMRWKYLEVVEVCWVRRAAVVALAQTEGE
jgi:hypothetical protein